MRILGAHISNFYLGGNMENLDLGLYPKSMFWQSRQFL